MGPEAAHTVIVEADEIVDIGEISPEQVHLPGLYVDRIFLSETCLHRNAMLQLHRGQSQPQMALQDVVCVVDRVRSTIARVAAQELLPGSRCNLGVGIPTIAAGYAAERGVQVYLQAENGVLGCGPYPARGKEDSNWINAGSESITPILGASTFGSDESFAQIRGGHLDMTILGVRLPRRKNYVLQG